MRTNNLLNNLAADNCVFHSSADWICNVETESRVFANHVCERVGELYCECGVYAITAMPTLPSTQSPEMHSTHERMHTRVCTHRNRCWPLRTLAYVVHVAVRLQVIRRVCLCVSWNRCATLRVCAACVCLRERSKCL